LVGGCKVKFTLLVSCSIFNNLYSFKFLKAMFFGYLHKVGTGRLGTAIENYHSAFSGISYLAHHGWDQKKVLK